MSLYVTVKFWSWVLVAVYPDTMFSTRTSGVCAPALAYVTVYWILLFCINELNVSLYFPVTLTGFTAIPVT